MNFTHLVATFGYWAVLVFVAIQCAGIPIPGGVIWATVIGLGAYYLGDSLHRPTGPLGIGLTVLVLCLFAICIRILLRNIRRLEDIAERMLPGPLDMSAGKKKQEAPRTPSTAHCTRCRPFHFLDTHQTLSTTSGQRSDLPTPPPRALERRAWRQGHAGVRSCRLWQNDTAGFVGRGDRSSHGLALTR